MRYNGRDLKASIPKVDLYDWYRRRTRRMAKRLFSKARRRWAKRIAKEGMK